MRIRCRTAGGKGYRAWGSPENSGTSRFSMGCSSFSTRAERPCSWSTVPKLGKNWGFFILWGGASSELRVGVARGAGGVVARWGAQGGDVPRRLAWEEPATAHLRADRGAAARGYAAHGRGGVCGGGRGRREGAAVDSGAARGDTQAGTLARRRFRR